MRVIKKSSKKVVLALSFILYIFGLFFTHIIIKDKDFSDIENRRLSKLPKFTMKKFFSGEFGEEFEEYIADQFPIRNLFISIKSKNELLMQRKDNNGVYIGTDGYFLQKFEKPNLELSKRSMSYINEFAKNSNTYFMVIPTATKILEEKLPKYATPYDEFEYITYLKEQENSNINFIPTFFSLMNSSESVKDEVNNISMNKDLFYYKTDHHWTTLGAYYGYIEFCKGYGIEPMKLADFNIETLSNEFYGSLFSKGNFTFATPDSVQIFTDKSFKNDLKVEYVNDKKITDTLYELSYLDAKDKYSLFLDNNHPLIKINTSVNNNKKILIIKDSYANCFIPFLTNHFEEIHVVDLRYNKTSMLEYMKQNNLEDVLFLYNVQSFSSEGIFSILKN